VSGGAAAAALAGCGGGSGGSGEGARGSSGRPDAKVRLASGKVSFRLMDNADTKSPFWEQLFAAYEKKHGNISCECDGLPWNKIEEVLPLGIRNGTAHDCIQLPASIPLSRAVENGWLAPFDDLIPDFEKWKAGLPELTFNDGAQVVDGKVYSVRLANERRYHNLLHFNREYLEAAGYDPSKKPLTCDEYRDAARKVTKAGKKRYYGVTWRSASPAASIRW